MIAALDVDYRGEAGAEHAVAACVLFEGWQAAEPAREWTVTVERVAPYLPGEFYRRELPCLLAALADVTEPLECVVIDGYVWLGKVGERPGLGAKLYDELGGRVPVVGVAKNPFEGARAQVMVHRGGSDRPLFLTSVGIDRGEAVQRVQSMHGEHRLPTLLARADALCRGLPGEGGPG